MARKKRILLNWWYDRKDLMEPFLSLSDDFELVWLYYRKPSGKERALPFRFVFWGDYRTPYQLLRKVKPDEVVFYAINDAPYQVGLALACRHQQIRTTICDRGLRAYSDYESPTAIYKSGVLHAVWFLLSGIRTRRLVPAVGKLAMLKLRGNPAIAQLPGFRELRTAARYLCNSAENAGFFTFRDGVEPERITLIGNPDFDAFFREQPAQPPPENFYLLIDQPFSGQKGRPPLIGEEQMAALLEKLNHFAITRRHKLYIKLHPADYEREVLYSDPNVVYWRDYPVSVLTAQAQGVFGFCSTVLLPAIYTRKCILFRSKFVPLQQQWADMGVVKLLDLSDFYFEDLDFDFVDPPDSARQQLADRFLFKTDGRSLERLRNALLE